MRLRKRSGFNASGSRISSRPTSMIPRPAVIRDCVNSSSGYAFIGAPMKAPLRGVLRAAKLEGKSFTHASTDASRRSHPRSRRQRCRLCWGRRSGRWRTETRSAGRKTPWSPWGCRCKRANACLKHHKSCEVQWKALAQHRTFFSCVFRATWTSHDRHDRAPIIKWHSYLFVQKLLTNMTYNFYIIYIYFLDNLYLSIQLSSFLQWDDINNRFILQYDPSDIVDWIHFFLQKYLLTIST